VTLYAVGLGSSLGDRALSLDLGVRLLSANPDVRLVSVSKVYQTPPSGGAARGNFLNAAILIQWSRDPQTLLNLCKEIEVKAGRRPSKRWGDRRLDLDILWSNGDDYFEKSLSIPHSELNSRSFAVFPLLDLLPQSVSGERERYCDVAEKMVAPSLFGVLAQPPVRVMKGFRRG